MFIGSNSPKFGIIFATGTFIGRARVTMAARFRSRSAVLKEKGNCNLGPRQGAEIEAICKHELAIWRAWRCAWASHNLLLDSWLHLLFSLFSPSSSARTCAIAIDFLRILLRSHRVSEKNFHLERRSLRLTPHFLISRKILRYKIKDRIEDRSI